MNFIDTTVFAPADDPAEEARVRRDLRRAWQVPEEKTVLFCPRRLVKKNGVTLPALALAAMAPDERERFLLLHAGEGGERGEIEPHRPCRRSGGNSAAVGRQRAGDDILALYRLADIVLACRRCNSGERGGGDFTVRSPRRWPAAVP